MMADADGRDRPVTGVEREAAGVFDENAPVRTRPAGRRPAMHHAPLRTHSLRTQREPERAEETAS